MNKKTGAVPSSSVIVPFNRDDGGLFYLVPVNV